MWLSSSIVGHCEQRWRSRRDWTAGVADTVASYTAVWSQRVWHVPSCTRVPAAGGQMSWQSYRQYVQYSWTTQHSLCRAILHDKVCSGVILRCITVTNFVIHAACSTFLVVYICCFLWSHIVLWHCWLGVTRGIWPAENLWLVKTFNYPQRFWSNSWT